MSASVRTPGPLDLPALDAVLASWQHDGAPVQLHPGDLGWFSRRGPAATAAALRVWEQDGEVVAMSLLDGPGLLRFGIHPGHAANEDLARVIATDVDERSQDLFGDVRTLVEARGAVALGAALASRGWAPDEPWTPLRHALGTGASPAGLRTAVIDRLHAERWCAVHWDAFRGTEPTPAQLAHFAGGWRAVSDSPFGARVRLIAAYDESGEEAAVVAVWTGGQGRPGLIEPLGVHRAFRGRGFGTGVTTAGVDSLRALGASSAIVCAEASNAAAVRTYVGAGFAAEPDVTDWRRPDG